MLLTLLLSFTLQTNCDHDKESHPDLFFTKATRKIKEETIIERSKPRIFFDLDAIDTTSDHIFRCKEEGQVVEKFGQCQASDVLTAKKANAIIGTMNSLKEFLEMSFKITPTKSDFNLELYDRISGSIPNKTVKNTDIYFSVLTRPYGVGSSTLASATSIQLDTNAANRPCQAVVFINPSRVPDSPQTYNEYPHEFFATCYHEVCHALGISQNLYEYWIDPSTGKEYGKNNTKQMQSGTYLGKKFTFLVTPESHRYAVKRFGKEYFDLDNNVQIPAGIEIEDGGGSGTAGSHPEARMYVGEVMVGVSTLNSVISELSFAILKDTGWYDVNYTMCTGLQWLNYRSFTSNSENNFPVGPPPTSFPSHYLCEKNGSDQCTYDYTGIGICTLLPFDCNQNPDYLTDEDKAFCAAQQWYNPKNESARGRLAVFDYISFITPYSNRDCTNKNTFEGKKDEYVGSDGRCMQRSTGQFGCFRTRCSGLKLFVAVDGAEYECTSKGAEIGGLFNGVRCPDPEHICRGYSVQQRLPADPMSLEFEPALVDMESIGGKPKGWLWYAVIGAAALILLIGIIACCCCCKRKSKQVGGSTESSDLYKKKKKRSKHSKKNKKKAKSEEPSEKKKGGKKKKEIAVKKKTPKYDSDSESDIFKKRPKRSRKRVASK